MSDSEALVGELVRILMENQSRSAPTRKQNIRALLKLGPKETVALMEASRQYLLKLGLELVGVGKAGVVELAEAEKYFIRKVQASDEARALCPEESKRLVLVFTIIILEQMSVEPSRLWFFVQKAKAFEGEEEFNEFIRWARGCGYLSIAKIEEAPSIGLGWRYYCDFPSFDPKGYFRDSSH